MAKRMLIDATHAEETRVAIVSGTKLEEFDFEIASRRQLKSNIYLAKITRVEPSLQAAFVEYGGNRHGFLPFPEIHPDYYQIPVADRERLEAAMASQAEEAEEKRERAERGDRPERTSERGGERGDRERGGRGRRRRRRPRPGDAPGSEASASDEASDETSEELRTDELSGDLDEAAARGESYEAHDAETHDDAHDDHTHEEEEEHAADAHADEHVHEHGSEEKRADEKTDDETPPPSRPREALMASNLDQSLTGEAPNDAEKDEHAAHDHAEHEHESDHASVEPDAEQVEASGAEEAEHTEAASADGAINGEHGNGEGGETAPAEKPEELGGDDVEDMQRKRRSQMPRYKIQEVIKRRQIMLIQVSKEERGNKGAAVTTFLSLPGRYCVLMPNTPRGGGVSRKIANAGDRKKMKELLSELDVPDGMSVILRTAGLERSKTEIKRDLDYLLRLWDSIRETTLQSTAPALIYEEGRLIKRAIRDLYARDIDEVLVAGDEGYRQAKDFMRMLMPSHAKRVQPYRDEVPLLFKYGVESQIDAMHSPVAQLKSGGYIVINQTEALVSIDVNSGRSTRERGIEETALKTNCEAADEIARQLRLRDLGGLIVIDFIDMEDPKHDSQVERRLKEAMKTDRARIQIGRISAFGLLELSRQRLHPSLQETNFETCIHCRGLGVVRSTESTSLLVLRGIEEEGIKRRATEIQVRVPPQIALFILNHKRGAVAEIEQRYGMRVLIAVDESLLIPEFRVERLRLRGPDEPAPPPIRQVYMPEPEPETDDDIVEDEEETEEARPARERSGERSSERASERSGERAERSAPTSDEDRRGNRRRRRRRRGGRRDGEAGHATEADEAADAHADQHAADDSAIEHSEHEGGAQHAEAGEHAGGEEGDGAARRRRRGRRGGRGRSRDRVRNEQGELVEVSPHESDESEAVLDDQPPPPTVSHADEELPFPPPVAPVKIEPAVERAAPVKSVAVEDPAAPKLDDQPPPPRDYEVVNQPPETPRRGWWKRISS